VDAVLPLVAESLVPLGARPHIRALAGQLAPIVRCGFEVRLGASDDVDFQQGIAGPGDEPRRLRAYLARAGADAPAWRGIDALLAAWCNERSPLHGTLRDLWLEFDRPPRSALSVFAGLRDKADPAHAEAALDRLAGRDTWAAWRSAVRRCFDATPPHGRIGHLGLMLGRSAPFMRVNVGGLTAEDVTPYLDQVRWPGDRDAAAALFGQIHPMVDAITLCLDVGEDVGPGLGLECHLHKQPPAEARWDPFLAHLVERGWCTPAKRAALLEWPEVTLPGEITDPWPAHLVHESLRRPADHLTALERRLNHVKLTYSPAEGVEAKGYFGFLHKWLQPPAEPDEAPTPRVRRRAGDALAAAVAMAADCLVAARVRAGWWRDFTGDTPEWVTRWGDEWVTAYVGTALAGTSHVAARAAAHGAWGLLVERRQPSAGWGYNRLEPVDADSTTWGLRLAAAIGTTGSWPARNARAALAQHILADGGITTYRVDACPRPAAHHLKPPGGSHAGWCRTSHACVTAGAAPIVGEPALEYLRGAQRADGSWLGYWWADDEYATALAAEALTATGRPDDARRVSRSVEWAGARVGADGTIGDSPFATALGLRILKLDARGQGPAQRALRWLLDQQEADGGWRASARLQSPRPDVIDPSTRPPATAAVDDARTFTTATVLTALVGSAA
jgi:hypothetical protein